MMATDWAEIERCVNLAYEDYGEPQEALTNAWLNCNLLAHPKEERMLWQWSMLFYDGEKPQTEATTGLNPRFIQDANNQVEEAK